MTNTIEESIAGLKKAVETLTQMPLYNGGMGYTETQEMIRKINNQIRFLKEVA